MGLLSGAPFSAYRMRAWTHCRCAPPARPRDHCPGLSIIAAAFLTNGVRISSGRQRLPFIRIPSSGYSERSSVRRRPMSSGPVQFARRPPVLLANIGLLYSGTPGDTIFVAAGVLTSGVSADADLQTRQPRTSYLHHASDFCSDLHHATNKFRQLQMPGSSRA
jgi:hypothetical protein